MNCSTYKDINFLSVNCINIGMILSLVHVMVIVGAGGETVLSSLVSKQTFKT